LVERVSGTQQLFFVKNFGKNWQKLAKIGKFWKIEKIFDKKNYQKN